MPERIQKIISASGLMSAARRRNISAGRVTVNGHRSPRRQGGAG